MTDKNKKMDSTSKDKIKEIAEQLDCGFRAFIHTTTEELIFVPDNTNYPDIEMNSWVEELNELENHFFDYNEIEKWTSSQAFEMMCEFADQLTDKKLQSRLFDALNKRKPFREFKFVIENSVDRRQEWFDFKSSWQQDFVARQLSRENQQTNEENGST